MNANLLLRRLQTLDIRHITKGVLPITIDVLLYGGKESPMMCPHQLPSPVSVKSFSIHRLSGVGRIDERLTPHNLAYIVFYSGGIVHESWVSFDVLLPSQYGYDSRFPVIGHSSTHPTYRGNSLYPYALSYILNDLRNSHVSRNAYILTNPKNEASIRGIEKAGYQRIARLKGTRVLGFFMINKSTIRTEKEEQ